jgi:hypothetical protein
MLVLPANSVSLSGVVSAFAASVGYHRTAAQREGVFGHDGPGRVVRDVGGERCTARDIADGRLQIYGAMFLFCCAAISETPGLVRSQSSQSAWGELYRLRSRNRQDRFFTSAEG